MEKKFLVVFYLVVLACAEEAEQKKRGAAKTTSLNAIPTGAQKTDYAYSIYPQGQSTNPQQSYQSPLSNSFYPNQGASQYYASSQDQSGYIQQPQHNLIPPSPPASQFVPINFLPSAGYQAKYQIVPTKTPQGNIQLLIQQPSAVQNSPVYQIPQYFAGNPQQTSYLGTIPQGSFNGFPNIPFQLGGNFLQQPAFLLAPPNAGSQQPQYNNLLYPSPLQSFYNYYPSNGQAKYNVGYGSQAAQSSEYEKLPGPITQSISKEDNELAGQSSEYSASDSYKSYSNRSPTYSKPT